MLTRYRGMRHFVSLIRANFVFNQIQLNYIICVDMVVLLLELRVLNVSSARLTSHTELLK